MYMKCVVVKVGWAGGLSRCGLISFAVCVEVFARDDDGEVSPNLRNYARSSIT